jgi:hypothetical protein
MRTTVFRLLLVIVLTMIFVGCSGAIINYRQFDNNAKCDVWVKYFEQPKGDVAKGDTIPFGKMFAQNLAGYLQNKGVLTSECAY